MEEAQGATQARLQGWSVGQAWLMLTVLAVATPIFASAAATVSFGVLIAQSRGGWTPTNRFGSANAATLLRLLLILALPLVPGPEPTPRFALALAALALDGVDGWLARRLGLCSDFGAHFDQEVDALFVAMLGLLLLRDGRLGPWILVPGALRYAFVLFLALARPPETRETGTHLGKVICVVVILALMVCLLPAPRIRAPVALAATLLLSGSFGVSVWRMYVPRTA